MIDALPTPQRIALSYATVRTRPVIFALLALDVRLAAILRGRHEPIATQMRLAWWRDTLARSPAEWPRGEPQLEALRIWRNPASLASLPSAWEALLSDRLGPGEIAEFVDGRSQAFAALAQELGVEAIDDAVASARIWALADLAAHLSDGTERGLVVDYGRSLGAPPHLSASLRPLAVLAALGAAALARGGGDLAHGPLSAFHALRIGLTGR